MSRQNFATNGDRDNQNESFSKRLDEDDEQFQDNGENQRRMIDGEDGNNMRQERGATIDQFHTNKSSQMINNNNYSYMSGSDKQYLSSQQNLQYYDKHDYNADNPPPPMKKNVVEAYNKLHDYVQDIHSQITEKMKKSEEDFLYIFKEQMYTIQKELKALKKKMDDELLRQKANDKMNILTEERDYFKAEALRLDRTCKEQEREIEELQFKQKVLTEDKNYYEGFVIETKKENKSLKSELLQLYKFKNAENNQNLKESQANQQQMSNLQGLNTGVSQLQMTGGENIPDYENMSDFRPHTTQHQRDGDIFLSEVKYNTSQKNIKTTTVPTTGSSNIQTQQNIYSSHRAQTHHQKSRNKFSEMTGGSEQGSKYQQFNTQAPLTQTEEMQQEIDQFKQNEEKYIETIKQLRVFLDKEKTNIKHSNTLKKQRESEDQIAILSQQNRKVKASLSQTYQQRSDLEQILLECINETKKDIQRRKAMQKADQLSLQATHLKRSQTSLKGQLQILGDEDIPFSVFNSKDKMKTLKQFISSDRFLDQIYQITFGHSKIPKIEKEKLFIETEVDIQKKPKDQNKFLLTESWKQDAQTATQVFQNFKGFKYSFKPQTASKCKSISSKDLKSPLFNFTEKTGKQLNLIQQVQIDPLQIQTPQISYKHKLYKDVCKEFYSKTYENKILQGI